MAEALTPTNLQSLDNLAIEIMKAHTAALSSARTGLDHAHRAGDLLIETKGLLPHGAWSQWLSVHCNFDIRTAQGYMQIARGWPLIQEHRNAYPETLLDITAARKLLADKGVKDEDDEEDVVTPAKSKGTTFSAKTLLPPALRMAPNRTQTLRLDFAPWERRQFQTHIDELAAQLGVTETKEAARIVTVVARAHAALVHSADEPDSVDPERPHV
jgi:hypothetical protein